MVKTKVRKTHHFGSTDYTKVGVVGQLIIKTRSNDYVNMINNQMTRPKWSLDYPVLSGWSKEHACDPLTYCLQSNNYVNVINSRMTRPKWSLDYPVL